mmetsp:Transcript_22002/g.48068  ORF Transcript_22002/g.48068 Transcript_22002/m.48068 type:complete len:364 (-) Transcript_22002:589-1680(-)
MSVVAAASKAERAAGVAMGILIGDALGMGSHWIYDPAEFKKLYGWQTTYVDPTEGRYHFGKLKAGDITQSGELSAKFLNTLASQGGYDRNHFTAQFDEMLKVLDGTRKGGDHGWTNKDICDVWRRRVVNKAEWGPDTASPTCDSTDSIVRAGLAAARYYYDLPKMIEVIRDQATLHYKDIGVITQSICFGCIIAAIINGHPLDEKLGDYLYTSAQEGDLPFSFLRGDRDEEEGLAEPDGLLLISCIYSAAHDPEAGGAVEAHCGARLYGLPCAWFMCLPSAYFCASKHPKDFEKAVLASINAGGQNVARGSFVGALVGAEVGVNNIPKGWIEGLTKGDEYLAMAKKIAADAEAGAAAAAAAKK